jgi:Ethanolamine utilization protein EutJ (predicted chaperonin)
VRRRESSNELWNDSSNHTHAGARAVAAIEISHTHAAIPIGTEVRATRQVVDLIPIASIAIAIDPPNGVALTLPFTECHAEAKAKKRLVSS